MTDILRPLQGLFDADLAQTLASAAQPVNAPAGTQLFSPGSPCRRFLLLLDGVVRVQVLSRNGREIVLYRIYPGDSCVVTASCLLGSIAYPATGIAETPIHGAILPTPVFERLLAESPAFRRFVFSAYAARLTDLVARIEEVALERIDARLARLLLRLALPTTNIVERTHQDLAADLGSAREVVSRQLKTFEQSGWVELQRGCIRLLDRRAFEILIAD
ncbi:MAG: Crp/Fnr family transcriptional regulator [Azoarcus sp.]|jgi:CRP/FNR family transcriptional regulator|nr:Crp/Fnr family transcriptional regulator [Azoarcus sp.]